MTAESNIINCFKKHETELLLACVMIDTLAEFIHVTFDFDTGLITALYSCHRRQFLMLVHGQLKIELTDLP